ncbi:MAG TPA: hypothetical protein VN915_04195 [Elusimicrobiota bacterium]|nr:hypothetical protein [Elusimicrobiota bacterium]
MARKSESEPQKDLAKTYDAFKNYEGRRYTGMRVGGHHKWYYDKGVWKETKVAPDRWQINFAVVKRRAGHAPEGSGAAVGTEYHWYILSHQTVRKLDANSYTTAMTGLKYMLAYKRAATGKWSASDRAQRRKLAKILREAAEELERQDAAPAAPPTAKRGGRPVASRARRGGGLRRPGSRSMIPG